MTDYSKGFICYKCGYDHFGNGTICPKCGTDNKVSGLMNFYMILLFITFASLFLLVVNEFFWVLLFFCAIANIITLPFLLVDCYKRSKVKNGLRVPADTPTEITENKVRVPDLMSFHYEAGLNFSHRISEITLDISPDGLIIYKDKMEEVVTVDYEDIANIEISTEKEPQTSFAKGLFGGVVGSFFGIGGTVAGSIIGGMSSKKVTYMEIFVKTENDIRSLLVSGDKHKIEKFYSKIYNKIPS